MKKNLPLLIILLAAAGACSAALSDASATLSCSFKVFARCGDGSASVKLLNGKVQQVTFESVFCARQGKPANRCSLDTARGGKDQWTDADKGVRIEFPNEKHPDIDDSMVVSLEQRAIVLDFTDTQSLTKCSMGVDLPEKVTIDPDVQQCQVEY
jgi:hypothetical protein